MKLINNLFNKETGETIITIACRDGQFKGKAKLHPDDKDFISKFAGARLAEERAWIKYIKYERRKKKNMLAAIQNLNKDIENFCSNVPDEIQKRINFKLRDYKKEIEDCSNAIKILEKTIKD